tara:strand:- start:186 stop:791 length:606 start_codon:yes stop_codon:yes gene_type:complete
MKKLNVLIGCEYSGVVRDAFAKLGHNAWSCDLLPTDRPNPKHIQGDIFNILDQDWNLAIFHPPCQNLAISGAAHFKEKIKDGRQAASIKFFERLYECNIPHICLENPVGVISTKSYIGKPTQYIQPYEYGHYETKKTGLWLRGLNPLVPTDIKDLTGIPKKVVQRLHYLPPSKDRWKIRSQTYQGIADAMAQQFSKQLEGI